MVMSKHEATVKEKAEAKAPPATPASAPQMRYTQLSSFPNTILVLRLSGRTGLRPTPLAISNLQLFG